MTEPGAVGRDVPRVAGVPLAEAGMLGWEELPLAPQAVS